MTTALMCLLIVAILPYVFTGAGAYLRIKQFGSLDDQQPRVQALELRGTGARAYAAQHNAWEALAFFASAVVVTHLVGVDPATRGRRTSRTSRLETFLFFQVVPFAIPSRPLH